MIVFCVQKGINMNEQSEINRVAVGIYPRSQAEELSEYLSYKGVDCILCLDEDRDKCILTVASAHEARAREILSYREQVEQAVPKKSRIAFAKVNEKLSDIRVSAVLFIVCGAVVCALGVFRNIPLFMTEGFTTGKALAIAELILGLFFLLLGIRTFIKAHDAKKRLREESAFTLKVITWFLGTYSAEDLDKVLESRQRSSANGPDGGSSSTAGVNPAQERIDLIRSYISREFDVEDPGYLDYLTQEVYTAIYRLRKFRA